MRGSEQRLPVKRIFCVGRNYHAHAIEMNRPVDKATMRPFYFIKDASTLVESGATVPYPTGTANYHFEMELVVVVGKPGFRVAEENAGELIYGYAAGLDMTRRDLQGEAKKLGRPWDWGKGFDNSAPMGAIRTVADIGHPSEGRIWLAVNGEVKQDGNLNELIWPMPEIIAFASRSMRLEPGDLIMTGTPAGVGPVVAGQTITGGVDGVGEIKLTYEL